MRRLLEVLAVAYPQWLRQQVSVDWFDRYGDRFEEYRLPESKAERYQLAETISRDGLYLWQRLEAVEKGLPPDTHLIDSGYIEAGNLATSAQQQIDLFGPATLDTSWQGRTPDAFDLVTFAIDWQAHQVTCPNGAQSRIWSFSHFTRAVAYWRSIPKAQTRPSAVLALAVT
jgi:hypothetical protein